MNYRFVFEPDSAEAERDAGEQPVHLHEGGLRSVAAAVVLGRRCISEECHKPKIFDVSPGGYSTTVNTWFIRLSYHFGQLPVGYDHCFVADREGYRLDPIARVVDPAGGRGLEISTTKPAVQLYTGNFLDGIRGAGGTVFNKHTALCLETEYYPDAVNHPEFPSAVLRPGEIYSHTTVHRFFSE